MPEPTKTMTAADEARAWLERLVRNADECNAQNVADPIPEENCPPTHFSAVVRLKPLPDGRVSMYEPGVEVTPDRLRAFLAEHAEMAAELERLRALVGKEEVSWAVRAGHGADGDEIYHSTAEEYAREAAARGIPVTKWVTRVYPTAVYDMEQGESGEWREVGERREVGDDDG